MTNVGLVLLGAFQRAQRRPDRRRAVELRLPVHAARVPAAPDRLRPVRAAALARRLEARAGGARRADRARPARRRSAWPPDGTGVRLDDVAFTFAGETRPALDGRRRSTSPPGAIVAVVGPTGAGKTTLVEIVGGLCRADVGHASRVGAGARAVVFQEAFLFAGSIRHNLELGDDVDDDELWEALRLARADDVRRRHAARARHRRRRARRQPQRRPAPARRAGPGARAPTVAAAARRHDVGARPGDRGRRARQPPRRAGRHDGADGRLAAVDDRPRRRGRVPRRRPGRRPRPPRRPDGAPAGLPRPRRGVRDRPRRRRRRASVVRRRRGRRRWTEPVGRFGAAHTINRGLAGGARRCARGSA